MRIGDVVVPSDIERAQVMRGEFKFTLACGSGWYSHAICVDVDPFVLVSEHGDMLWSNVDEAKFTSLCQAHPDIVLTATARYQRDFANGTININKHIVEK